ncbi:MAG: hypothetical protein Q8R36_03180 [bacterium]|nr:hypothetical protein [bacterium]
MATTKKRINISVPREVDNALLWLARRDHVPQATKAARLIEVALELEEDIMWDAIARARDTKNARFVSHRRAWK